MTALLHDLRYAVRLLLRTPGFSLLAALTLGLGIGANAAIFSVINAVLLAPLPYGSPERLTIVYSQFPTMNFNRFWTSAPEFLELRQKSKSFEELGAYTTGAANITGGDEPVRVRAARVSAGLFTVLGVKPELGRYFTAREDLPNMEPVVVLSHELWQRVFGGERGVVGRRVQVDGVDRTVLGVMPAGFDVADERVEAWVPLALDPGNPGGRASHYLYMVGLLKPGVGFAQARSELAGLVTRWKDELPDTHVPDPENHPLVIQPLLEDLVGSIRPKMWLLMGAVGLVLLIACANVANLLLARAEARQKEIAVRTALGAARGRLIRQFLTESVVLSLLGAAVGLLLAFWGVRAIVATNPDSLPRVREIAIDGRVLLFTLGIAILTGLLFGLAPALHARASVLFSSLKEGSQRSTAGAGRQLLRRSLVIAEVALAATLVIVGGLLIRSFWLLQQVDPGFNPERVLTFQIALPDARYPDEPQVVAFYQRLVDRLRVLPGVETASAAWGLPPKRNILANDTEFEGVPEPPNGPVHNVDYWQFVTHDYLKTLNIPVVSGRGFLPSDAAKTPGVVLVNETTAKLFWPGKDPIGRRLRAPAEPDQPLPWLTVVGVVKDVKQAGLEAKTGTEVYFLHSQMPETLAGASDDMYLLVRAAGDPLNLVSQVRREVQALDPSLPLADIRSLEQVVFESVAQPRFITRMALLFAAVALALAAVGTYGVLSYSVEQRTQEIGVRMALGAQGKQVLGMVLAQGVGLVAVGLVVGVIGALALRRLLAGMLFGVAPTDPTIFASVVVLLSAVSLVACYLPARRATRIDPLVALRYE
ncbi:MAG TPA: ABC transporter permease [Thermoanaerobaculia bacterium]|nr:ABC transporter permease [Thermoanaerobaculia bacterium]